MENKRKTPRRLVIDLTDEEHQLIRIYAAKRNITIKKFVLRAITEAVIREKQYE